MLKECLTSALETCKAAQDTAENYREQSRKFLERVAVKLEAINGRSRVLSS